MMVTTEPCPKCHRIPHKWIEAAKFRSSQMFWIGCEHCGILAGGKSVLIAGQNWTRQVMRVRHEMGVR